MKSMVLLTNILTPYRVHFYDAIEKVCCNKGIRFHVLVMSKTEENRNWMYEDYARSYTILLKGKRIKVGNVCININEIKSILKELNPEFVIAAGSYIHPTIWELLWLKKKLGYKTFFWSESHLNTVRNYSALKIKVRDFIRKKIYSSFDGFFYAGKLSLEFIEKYCSNTAKMIFLPNLIDNAYYAKSVCNEQNKKELLDKWKIEKDEKVYICPVRLSSDKGIIPFFDLLKETTTKHPYTVVIAGDGYQKQEIETYIQKAQLNVKMVGYQQQDAIRELYQLSDGFILPSIVDPNPLTCVEALWSKLPLLVSEHVGNNPEVVENGVNGFVFSYTNKDESIHLIEQFIDADDEWMENAKEVSYKIANKSYCSERETQRIIQEIIEYVESVKECE